MIILQISNNYQKAKKATIINPILLLIAFIYCIKLKDELI